MKNGIFKFVSLIFLGLLFGVPVKASELGLAIVYRGKGACAPCALGAARAALGAHLRVQYVDEQLRDFSLLDQAKVWIQPGGVSKLAIESMGEAYLAHVREFVRRGGGYVGFCAGAFLSTEHNGTTDALGLGIVPGQTKPLFVDFSRDDHPYFMRMTWNKQHRFIYFNGGAYFDLSGITDPNVVVLATYDDYDQKIAALETRYGLGKIAVSGAHPEELNSVKLSRFMRDPDGSDRDLAIEMIEAVK